MSGAALETLAIVAYKQPISRAQIASIRGVDPDGVLRTLQGRGYIDAVGHDPGPGQAVLYGTTPTFLEKLGLDRVEDLPPIAEFIPGADVVEALEAGLRGTDAPAPDPTGSSGRAGSGCRRSSRRRGYGSRRACEELIAAGRVTVNGSVAVLGGGARSRGRPCGGRWCTGRHQAGLVHYLLNKPAGVVTTARDTHGRPTVVELVPAEPRVFPVGRLDADTEGLLLLTNDGELANRIAHPRHGLAKEYLATVDGGRRRRERRARSAACARASSWKTARPRRRGSPSRARACCGSRSTRVATARCDGCPTAVGHPVTRLVRTRIGPVQDRRLKPGAWRRLDPDEVRRLAEATT